MLSQYSLASIVLTLLLTSLLHCHGFRFHMDRSSTILVSSGSILAMKRTHPHWQGSIFLSMPMPSSHSSLAPFVVLCEKHHRLISTSHCCFPLQRQPSFSSETEVTEVLSVGCFSCLKISPNRGGIDRIVFRSYRSAATVRTGILCWSSLLHLCYYWCCHVRP